MSEPSSIVIRNIFHMLCYAFKVLRQQNYRMIAEEEFEHVQDMLAAILARGIAQQVKQGLYRTYITYDREQKKLQGKLNPYPTKRLQSMKKQLMDCTYDELSEDNEPNRILKATCASLLTCREVEMRQKKDIRKLMFYFGNISDIDLSTVKWSRLQFSRNSQSYVMLMNVCYMIRQSLLPSTDAGRKKFTMFDEDSMPRLYEKFILEYYRQHFPMLHASDNAIEWDIPEDTDPAAKRLLPGMHSDIFLRYGDQIHIIDAKYYKHSLASYMDKQMLINANLYQIYTYVKNQDKTRTGKVSGMLLYAKTTEPTPPYLDVIMGGNQIMIQTLDLNRSFPEIAYSLDQIVSKRFGDTLRRIA